MARYSFWLLLLLATGVISAPTKAADGAGAHAFWFTSIEGAPLSLADYAGRPLLVVQGLGAQLTSVEDGLCQVLA